MRNILRKILIFILMFILDLRDLSSSFPYQLLSQYSHFPHCNTSGTYRFVLTDKICPPANIRCAKLYPKEDYLFKGAKHRRVNLKLCKSPQLLNPCCSFSLSVQCGKRNISLLEKIIVFTLLMMNVMCLIFVRDSELFSQLRCVWMLHIEPYAAIASSCSPHHLCLPSQTQCYSFSWMPSAVN